MIKAPLRVGPFILLFMAAFAVARADWSQWRGPARDGLAHPMPLPATWPPELARVWSVAVGEGHASPVVSKGRVFVHTREQDQEVARAIHPSDGRTLWRESWDVPYTMHPAATGHGKGPKSTPLVSDGILYTVGITGAVAAFDAETGRVRWRRDFASAFKSTTPLFGVASSPLLHAGRLVLWAGGHHDGALMALDASTGEPRWSLKGDGPGYASPIVATTGARRQLILQSDRRVLGVSADTGELLWSLPFTTPYDQNAVTALASGELLIISGLEQGLRAYRLEAAAGGTAPAEVWRRDDLDLYMSSPVFAGKRLYGFTGKRKGQLFCVEIDSGRTVWTGPDAQGENAALAIVADHLLALTDSADLLVQPLGALAFEPVARYRVAESPTWAHPVPLAGDRPGLLIKDRMHLSLWSWPAPATGSAKAPKKAGR